MLNVDPERQADAFYRYKMPKVQTKIEGNGNGIKTVMVNIDQISQRLVRPVEYPMHFFAKKLGAKQIKKDDKWILMGHWEQPLIQASLFEFIQTYCLCKECRNPETTIQTDEQKNLYLNCAACSRVTPIDAKDEKFNSLILKTEMVVAPSKKEGKKKKHAKSKDEKEEEAFAKATRNATEADEIEGAEEKEELPNPVVVLRDFLATNPPEDEIRVKVFDIKQDYGLGDRHVVALVFEALFDENILTQIPEKSKILTRFVKEETEKQVIIAAMSLCADKESLNSRFHLVLKKLFDANVVSKESILDWYNTKTFKGIDKDLLKQFKEKTQPLIDWLQEESDDEDGEQEEDETE